jgi:hypothetical protein
LGASPKAEVPKATLARQPVTANLKKSKKRPTQKKKKGHKKNQHRKEPVHIDNSEKGGESSGFCYGTKGMVSEAAKT